MWRRFQTLFPTSQRIIVSTPPEKKKKTRNRPDTNNQEPNIPDQPEQEIHKGPAEPLLDAPERVPVREHAAQPDVGHEDGEVADAAGQAGHERPGGPAAARPRRHGRDVERDVGAESRRGGGEWTVGGWGAKKMVSPTEKRRKNDIGFCLNPGRDK